MHVPPDFDREPAWAESDGFDDRPPDEAPFDSDPRGEPLAALHVVVCNYCGHNAELVRGDVIYPRAPRLHDQYFWLCRPCDAYVGCHLPQRTVGKGGQVKVSPHDRPFGALANKAFRAVRHEAHKLFDPIWRSGSMSRKEAYIWVAQLLGIPAPRMHLGGLDEAECRRLVEHLRANPPIPSPGQEGGLAAQRTREPVPFDREAGLALAAQFASKVNNLASLSKRLASTNLRFDVKNNGHHVVVHATRETFDVYPSKQRWLARSKGVSQQGLDAFFKAAEAATA